jgi:alpha-methylacyl-CoA racemase
MSGPLRGFKVIEFAGIGPAPFCAMMLADMGAEVIRIERPGLSDEDPTRDPLLRSRRSVILNLKHPEGVATALKLLEQADVLIEGLRPGVAERLGIGPAACLARNPRLIFGRVTGWGQDGPLANVAGHDINYIALSGALHLIGPARGKPTMPLNLLGDFGGGGMLLLSGILAALLEVRHSGKGQVIDASMVDGTVAMMGMMFALRANGYFRDATGENMYAGGVPFYDVYETQDGKYISLGALEPQFYALLLEKLGITDPNLKGLGVQTVLEPQAQARWPALREELTRIFKTRRREDWCRLLEGTDVCFAPVLSVQEAMTHPHNVARGSFIEVGGVPQNAPAPRFSRSIPAAPSAGRLPGADNIAVLREAGLSAAQIERLKAVGALG